MDENSKEEQLLLKLELGPTSDCEGGNGADDGGSITLVLVFSILVAVCSSFVCGCAFGYTSPTQSGILADLGLSTADYSLFGSLLTIGALLGALVCGKLSDYIGRRASMGLSNILFLAGWLAIAFSQGAWSLDFGRLAVGFAGALVSYTVPVYIAEITPKNLRGGAILLHQLMLSVGIGATFIIGLITSWRMLALLAAVPCFVQLVGLIFIPESPRWLVKVGRGKEYIAALQRFRGEHADISQEAAEIKEFTEAMEKMPAGHENVFQMKYAYALTVSLGLMALAQLSGTSGIVFYATTIFESSGFSSTAGTIAMALMQLPPTVVGVFLMDNFGRRPLLLYSASGMSLACLSVASSFVMKEHGLMESFSPYLALIGILMSAATFPVGFGGIPFVIMSEIFPMNVKGAAGSLAAISSSVSGWAVSYAFNFMMVWSSSGTFFILAGINIFAILFIAKLVPETKGRTLEEIQESLAPESESL